jgi:hypothetical protein
MEFAETAKGGRDVEYCEEPVVFPGNQFESWWTWTGNCAATANGKYAQGGGWNGIYITYNSFSVYL